MRTSFLQQLFRKKSVSEILAELTEKESSGLQLKRHLGQKDLTALGIAAIVGAGIFSTIGQASYEGGPAVIFLFIFSAVACSFTAFAYAEFASMIPVSGSAYSYSYVAFGEIVAWIIGWSLIMEYAVGNITVAISWSDYFTGFLEQINIHFPRWLSMDYSSASAAYNEAIKLMDSGVDISAINTSVMEGFEAYSNAPVIASMRIIMDLPAFGIVFLVTVLVYRGVKESKNASNAMVVVKLAIILMILAVGFFYVDTDNWSPFAPNGMGGVLKGVSAVFFAYIGFDAISTTAEECKNPQRDLPRGMMWAIIICTILYILIALVLTGILNYTEYKNVGDPLAYVFERIGLKRLSGIIAVSAIVAMASVILVFQLGQPRIWMSMSRDGLLPRRFAKIHPKFKTPSFSTIITGIVVGVPALFLDLSFVTDLCSIGTLFAFSCVCAGVLVLNQRKDLPKGRFKIPYLNAGIYLPLILIAASVIIFVTYPEDVKDFVLNKPQLVKPSELVPDLTREEIQNLSFNNYDSENLLTYLEQIKSDDQYKQILQEGDIPLEKYILSGWDLFKLKIPMWTFIIFALFMIVLSVIRKFSLIPTLGLVSCFYMMCELHVSNWIGFGIWLIIGLIIYFTYSRKNSKLRSVSKTNA
ncbi:MAG: amino acid permease [Flavobacteriia bacterium]|mgnify:CR=1 FL=1|nr:amino acid permease [Flavobacteriia bacterium]OJX36564.1 MAG: amino acid permease [Flavobacteriia bacterium 40-80]